MNPPRVLNLPDTVSTHHHGKKMQASLPFNLSMGFFDEPNEQVTATVNPNGLSGGRHTLFMQGQDAAGNWGAVSAVFFESEYGYYFPLSYR